MTPFDIIVPVLIIPAIYWEILFGAIVLAHLIGYILGGWIGFWTATKWTLIVLAVLTVIGIIILYFVFRELNTERRHAETNNAIVQAGSLAGRKQW